GTAGLPHPHHRRRLWRNRVELAAAGQRVSAPARRSGAAAWPHAAAATAPSAPHPGSP
nr:hypothetical protein [Tanacetum cinerariifolium]